MDQIVFLLRFFSPIFLFCDYLICFSFASFFILSFWKSTPQSHNYFFSLSLFLSFSLSLSLSTPPSPLLIPLSLSFPPSLLPLPFSHSLFPTLPNPSLFSRPLYFLLLSTNTLNLRLFSTSLPSPFSYSLSLTLPQTPFLLLTPPLLSLIPPSLPHPLTLHPSSHLYPQGDTDESSVKCTGCKTSMTVKRETLRVSTLLVIQIIWSKISFLIHTVSSCSFSMLNDVDKKMMFAWPKYLWSTKISY